jgi:energy-coupling factor transporter ATP-binding protein EcfA2
MNQSASSKPAILILTGASGSGKTTLTLRLGELSIPGVECINCDRVKVEVPETADPSDLQVAILRHWVSELSREGRNAELAVLDTQIRPHRAREVLNQAGIRYGEIVLVDCDPVKRNARLRGARMQPELANVQMDCWAAYLRGQADALNLPIIDTSEDSIEKGLEHLIQIVRKLLDVAQRDAQLLEKRK